MSFRHKSSLRRPYNIRQYQLQLAHNDFSYALIHHITARYRPKVIHSNKILYFWHQSYPSSINTSKKSREFKEILHYQGSPNSF